MNKKEAYTSSFFMTKIHPSSTNLFHTKLLITKNGKKKVDPTNTKFIYCLYNFPLSYDIHARSLSIQIPRSFILPNTSGKRTLQSGIWAMWCFYQMAAPRREARSRFLSSPYKRNRWMPLSECCPSSRTPGSWPVSAPGDMKVHLAKPHWNRPRSSALCWSLQYRMAPTNST